MILYLYINYIIIFIILFQILLLFYIVAAVLAVQDARAVLAARADSDDSAVSLDNPPRKGTTQI
nr:MAG TPA: hypothetical protein [Crassvirales sp.]